MESVKEFYANRSVFITGGTGLIGKVLIEKLLRSCPKIDKIYVLIRNKKGKTPEERVRDITTIPLFDKLKEECPDAIKEKIKPVLGDVCEPKLGLSEADINVLIENVSIVFHGAASVRFDDTLKHAILMNTRGTRQVIDLTLKMKKIEVFLHISTTYCNSNMREVDEKLYPAHADWRQAIELAENIDEYVLQVLMPKYVDVLPNTYTFSKSLAEHCIYDLCKNKVPAIIIRPSIVTSSTCDPMPGWIDNFNGPTGILAASGKGVLRCICGNPNVTLDCIPVDIAVRSLLIGAWNKATTKNLSEKMDVSFYNCSNNGICSLTMGELLRFGMQVKWDSSLSGILWYPNCTINSSKFWYYLNVILFHLLPAMAVDAILKLLKKKPILVRVQRRIYIAMTSLYFFMTNQWSFPNSKLLALGNELSPEEVEEFGLHLHRLNLSEYLHNCMIGGRRYLLKDDDSTIAAAKTNTYRLYILDRVARFLLVVFLVWVFICKINILPYLAAKATAVYTSALI